MSKVQTVLCDNFEMVRDRMPVVLFINRKSHTAVRLVPTSVTLNGLERHIIGLILRYFTELDSLLALQANYVTVVEECPQRAIYRLPLTFGQN